VSRGRNPETHHSLSPSEREHAKQMLRRLLKKFPQPKTALLHENPFQLLISTILSAQCTDERVNMVTPELFKKYRSAAEFAAANRIELEQDIRSTGFYRMKAKSIIACSKVLVERHSGDVPRNMEALVRLPGVGRKTANVVLGQAFGITSGVVVDTHVHRLAQRMGFSASTTAEKVEADLMALFPRRHWVDLGSVLILHGRATCTARTPKCADCIVGDLCPSAQSFLKQMA
jgi:endonuclease-3